MTFRLPLWCRRRPSTRLIVGLVAAAAMVIVGAIGFVVLRPAGTAAHETAAHETAAGVSTTTSTDAAAAAALLRVLPRGYSGQNCKPAPGPAGATATVTCDRTPDPDGVVATFALIPDPGALGAAFNAATSGGGVVLCPGRIQSPGPWRRGGLPQPVLGSLVCATPSDGPLLAWTDTDKRLLATIRGTSLEQLHQWWTRHA